MQPFTSTIRDLRGAMLDASAHAMRHGRRARCRAAQVYWERKRDAFRKAGGAIRGFDPARVRAARLALIAEYRAVAWGSLAEGDATTALIFWLRALNHEVTITGRRPPRWEVV